MKTNQSSLWKNARRWLPGVVISIVALAVVFKLAKWQDLVSAFSAVKPLNLAVATILLVLSLYARTMVWWILLGRMAPYKRTFNIINIGYLLNNILPLRAGEVGRAILMGNITGLGPLFVLSTIVIERTYDLAIASGLLLATLPMVISYAIGTSVSWAKPVAIGTLSLVVIGLCSMYFIAQSNQRVKSWIDRLGNRSQFLKNKVTPHIDALLDGMTILTQPKQFILSVFWIIVCWACYIAIYYIMLLPIVPGAPLWWSIFSDCVVALGVAVPSAPGGMGVWEASIVGSLSIFGVPTSSSLAYALLLHFINFIVVGIFGFYGLAREGQSLTSLFSRIQRERNPTA